MKDKGPKRPCSALEPKNNPVILVSDTDMNAQY